MPVTNESKIDDETAWKASKQDMLLFNMPEEVKEEPLPTVYLDLSQC